jgi:hypothetical protein
MKIMNEFNDVPVLDVFEASYLSADQHNRQDEIHYQTPSHIRQSATMRSLN